MPRPSRYATCPLETGATPPLTRMATRRTRLVPASHKRLNHGREAQCLARIRCNNLDSKWRRLDDSICGFAIGAAVLLAAGAAEAVVPEADASNTSMPVSNQGITLTSCLRLTGAARKLARPIFGDDECCRAHTVSEDLFIRGPDVGRPNVRPRCADGDRAS
jgi:hypothetical protein